MTMYDNDLMSDALVEWWDKRNFEERKDLYAHWKFKQDTLKKLAEGNREKDKN